MCVFPYEIQQKGKIIEIGNSGRRQNVGISYGNITISKNSQSLTKSSIPKMSIITVVFERTCIWAQMTQKTVSNFDGNPCRFFVFCMEPMERVCEPPNLGTWKC